jgi:DNA-binding transcriptional LysR family regulator
VPLKKLKAKDKVYEFAGCDGSYVAPVRDCPCMKPRGVELTDAGSALLTDARAILSQIDHAFAATKRTAGGEQGQISVGFTSSAPFHPFVPRIIRTYRDTFPLVSLTLEETGTTDLIDYLRNERIDAAFIRTMIPNQEGLVVNLLLQEGDGTRPAARSYARPACKPEQSSALEGTRGRNVHRLPAAQWSGALRCDFIGLQRSRI